MHGSRIFCYNKSMGLESVLYVVPLASHLRYSPFYIPQLKAVSFRQYNLTNLLYWLKFLHHHHQYFARTF
ncbi:hypothetical protein 04086_4668 [Escherichia phage 04086]|nr:hypothetical protein 04086_4668 [Escherichia phage 04086]